MEKHYQQPNVAQNQPPNFEEGTDLKANLDFQKQTILDKSQETFNKKTQEFGDPDENPCAVESNKKTGEENKLNVNNLNAEIENTSEQPNINRLGAIMSTLQSGVVSQSLYCSQSGQNTAVSIKEINKSNNCTDIQEANILSGPPQESQLNDANRKLKEARTQEYVPARTKLAKIEMPTVSEMDEFNTNQSPMSPYLGPSTSNQNQEQQEEILFKNEQRYLNTGDIISESRYRTIHRGYDNDSGCEIAWCIYPLIHQLTEQDEENMRKVLDTVKNVRHQYILKCNDYDICKLPQSKTSTPISQMTSRNTTVLDADMQSIDSHALGSQLESANSQNTPTMRPHLILITELITAGSIREYLKKIRLPRLIVIKNWCFKLLQGLVFLNQNNLVHGKLTCESIYINSNNGDIKIGDLGIRQIPLFNWKRSEIHQSLVLKNEKKTSKYDVYCFGLVLLEMITSDLQIPNAFKYICKIINQGNLDQIINNIQNEQIQNLLHATMIEDPEKRMSIADLSNHSFFQNSQNDHGPIQIKQDLADVLWKICSESQKLSQLQIGSPLTHNKNNGNASIQQSVSQISPSQDDAEERPYYTTSYPDIQSRGSKICKNLNLNQSYPNSNMVHISNDQKQIQENQVQQANHGNLSQTIQIDSKQIIEKSGQKKTLKESFEQSQKNISKRKNSDQIQKVKASNSILDLQRVKMSTDDKSQATLSQVSQAQSIKSLYIQQIPETEMSSTKTLSEATNRFHEKKGQSKSKDKSVKKSEDIKQFNDKQIQQKAKSLSPKDSNEIPLMPEKQKTIQNQNQTRNSANVGKKYKNLNDQNEESSSFQPSSAQSKKYKKVKKQKVIKFFIKFKLGKKQYEIDFKYDTEHDNPQKIANEMRDSLNLPAEKIDAIKRQIEQTIMHRIPKNIVPDGSKAFSQYPEPTPAVWQSQKEQQKIEYLDQNDKRQQRRNTTNNMPNNVSEKVEQKVIVEQQPIKRMPIVQENQVKTEPKNECVMQQKFKEMRAKSNNKLKVSNYAKSYKDSLMEPIEESNFDENTVSKSKSLHDASKGMLQPNLPSKMNKTMNYEIYNENARDKDECPQYNLCDQKEFKNSVQYPHGTLNLSNDNRSYIQPQMLKEQKLQLNDEIKSELKKIKNEKVDTHTPQKSQADFCSICNQNAKKSLEINERSAGPHFKGCGFCTHKGIQQAPSTLNNNLTHKNLHFNSIEVQQAIENDRNELLNILEKIPEIDISQFPGEDFLYQEYPDFQHYQLQYHQKQEQEFQNMIKMKAGVGTVVETPSGTNSIQQAHSQPHHHLQNSHFNDTLLEFDYNLDLLHHMNGCAWQTAQHPTGAGSSQQQQPHPFVCDDISVILPTPMQNIHVSSLPNSLNCVAGTEAGLHQAANVNTPNNHNNGNINSHLHSNNHSLVFTNQLLEHLNIKSNAKQHNSSKEKLQHNNSKSYMQNSGHQNCLICSANNSLNRIITQNMLLQSNEQTAKNQDQYECKLNILSLNQSSVENVLKTQSNSHSQIQVPYIINQQMQGAQLSTIEKSLSHANLQTIPPPQNNQPSQQILLEKSQQTAQLSLPNSHMSHNSHLSSNLQFPITAAGTGGTQANLNQNSSTSYSHSTISTTGQNIASGATGTIMHQNVNGAAPYSFPTLDSNQAHQDHQQAHENKPIDYIDYKHQEHQNEESVDLPNSLTICQNKENDPISKQQYDQNKIHLEASKSEN